MVAREKDLSRIDLRELERRFRDGDTDVICIKPNRPWNQERYAVKIHESFFRIEHPIGDGMLYVERVDVERGRSGDFIVVSGQIGNQHSHISTPADMSYPLLQEKLRERRAEMNLAHAARYNI